MSARDELARHLNELRRGKSGSIGSATADAILADPQAHVDALEQAGVIRHAGFYNFSSAHYTVVPPTPPHEHDWRIVTIAPLGGGHKLGLWCGCRESSEVWVDMLPKYEGFRRDR